MFLYVILSNSLNQSEIFRYGKNIPENTTAASLDIFKLVIYKVTVVKFLLQMYSKIWRKSKITQYVEWP